MTSWIVSSSVRMPESVSLRIWAQIIELRPVHETMGRKTNQRRSDRWTEGQASRQTERQTVTFTRRRKGKFNLGEQRWRCVSSSIRLSAGERTAVFSCHPLTHAPLNRTEYFFFLIHTPGVLACKLLQRKIIHPTHPQPPPPPSCSHSGTDHRATYTRTLVD